MATTGGAKSADAYVPNPARDDTRVGAPSHVALDWLRGQPGYACTPLVALDDFAAELGLERVWVKDETGRGGLGSFKILGASWAIERALAAGPPDVTPTLVAATDGNHGRAVAAVARDRGLAAEILVPRGTSPDRIAAIELKGGTVRVVDGGYDDAVRAAAAQAEALGSAGLLVSDTALADDDPVPRWIAEGYVAVFAEVAEALAECGEAAPDLVLLPVGVGGLASTGVRCLRHASTPVRLVSVEPSSAACAQASIAAGRVVTIDDTAFASMMVGLNAGTVSLTAWPDLFYGLDGTLAISDVENAASRATLHAAGVAAGDTGIAGVSGLKVLLRMWREDRSVAPWLVNVRSVLVLVTEGEVGSKF